MLRLLVLALLLLNCVYFGWSQGLLLGLGFAPAQQNEPQRLAQQIRPNAVLLSSPQDQRQIGTDTLVKTKPGACLQAGPFDETQSAKLRQKLEATLPDGSWILEDTLEPPRWIVYMGKYANAETLAKKRSEIASLNLTFEPLDNPALQFGLSLGGFQAQADAEAELKILSQRGVRTARVVLEHAELRGKLLRLPNIDDAMRARVAELTPLLAGKLLRPCQ
jgi:hypothetical protein